jgi:ribose-phosphate pyrophosphokinase
MKNFKIFALSNSLTLGRKIAENIGIPLGNIKLEKFSDGEMSPSIQESIRGHNVFLIGSTHQPHDNLFELALTIDAFNRAGVKKLILIVPYFGYSRADRKDESRSSIGATVAATIIESNLIKPIDGIITIDLHANQVEGFFKKTAPIHIKGYSLFVPHLKEIITPSEYVIVSPDAGGLKRAKYFAEHLGVSDLCVMNKVRTKANMIESTQLVGSVEGKKVLIIDDMADTCGTLCKSVDVLLENGALEVIACITHPVLSGKAYENLNNSNLKKLYTSDTIPLRGESSKIEIVSSSDILAKVIKGITVKESIHKITSL